jgi:ABC-type lipoprotein release transport system permease subunit
MKRGFKFQQGDKLSRNLQFVSFIVLALIAMGMITLVVMDMMPIGCLLAFIPMVLMMKKNIEMWEFYNDILILRKIMRSKEFKKLYDEQEEANKSSK